MDQITKNAAISANILAMCAEGATLRDAVDAVLGAGTYDQIAGDIYESLRARAAA